MDEKLHSEITGTAPPGVLLSAGGVGTTGDTAASEGRTRSGPSTAVTGPEQHPTRQNQLSNGRCAARLPAFGWPCPALTEDRQR